MGKTTFASQLITQPKGLFRGKAYCVDTATLCVPQCLVFVSPTNSITSRFANYKSIECLSQEQRFNAREMCKLKIMAPSLMFVEQTSIDTQTSSSMKVIHSIRMKRYLFIVWRHYGLLQWDFCVAWVELLI